MTDYVLNSQHNIVCWRKERKKSIESRKAKRKQYVPVSSYIFSPYIIMPPDFFSLFLLRLVLSFYLYVLTCKCSDSFLFSVKGNRRNCMQTNGLSEMMNLRVAGHLVWLKSLNRRHLLNKEWFAKWKEVTWVLRKWFQLL